MIGKLFISKARDWLSSALIMISIRDTQSKHHITIVYHFLKKSLCNLKYKAHTVGKDIDTYCINADNYFPIHLHFYIPI